MQSLEQHTRTGSFGVETKTPGIKQKKHVSLYRKKKNVYKSAGAPAKRMHRVLRLLSSSKAPKPFTVTVPFTRSHPLMVAELPCRALTRPQEAVLSVLPKGTLTHWWAERDPVARGEMCQRLQP